MIVEQDNKFSKRGWKNPTYSDNSFRRRVIKTFFVNHEQDTLLTLNELCSKQIPIRIFIADGNVTIRFRG